MNHNDDEKKKGDKEWLELVTRELRDENEWSKLTTRPLQDDKEKTDYQ